MRLLLEPAVIYVPFLFENNKFISRFSFVIMKIWQSERQRRNPLFRLLMKLLNLLNMNMNNLRALVRKIWEDGYQSGRSDARSDAAVEAAEAEWFNG